jgi:hypothetical protein
MVSRLERALPTAYRIVRGISRSLAGDLGIRGNRQLPRLTVNIPIIKDGSPEDRLFRMTAISDEPDQGFPDLRYRDANFMASRMPMQAGNFAVGTVIAGTLFMATLKTSVCTAGEGKVALDLPKQTVVDLGVAVVEAVRVRMAASFTVADRLVQITDIRKTIGQSAE